ncbi:hypothetical protein WJX82_009512 [Trebouxia sp. C0006]
MPTTQDHSSFANYLQAAVTHIDLDLSVHFDSKTVGGTAELHVNVNQSGTAELLLDTRDLIINSVVDKHTGQDLPFKFAEEHKALGTKLTIGFDKKLSEGQSIDIVISFSTMPKSTALQFLDPSQTGGGKHPYLFTQCQAIHARSFIPCQDTPAAKLTYSAAITVPTPLTALMSAVPQNSPEASADGAATHTFKFTQEVPIPSYLLALAVGELEYRQIGPRSKVWSEPSMVEAGAYEFADTAKFLSAAEEVAGEYVWGVYDLLLLPPSFPYGGMENPCLTFVTPTLLAGDRSLVNVVAHEIAHSWTGNLVTNATWEHFWLNEGFTVFLERKIIGRLHGEKALQFHAANGYLSLVDSIHQIGDTHNFTALVPDLSGGVDPDDSFSKVPYEKGFYFLYYLQGVVGGSQPFEAFLKTYLQHFKFKTLTTTDFKNFFCDYFKDTEAIQQIDWQTWLYSPGLPPVQNDYDPTLGQAAEALAKKWHTSDLMAMGSNGPQGASPDDTKDWSSEMVVAFLDKLASYRTRQPMHRKTTRRMAELYGLDSSKNAEIRGSWYKLAINAEDEAVLPLTVQFLKEQGRMKFLRPLYKALFKSKMGKDMAVQTFKEARQSYHPIAAKMVAADLQVD